ncbi:MAG TPA: acyl-CoA dehydrogenase family protein, partial [Polyangiaceae bacterium]
PRPLLETLEMLGPRFEERAASHDREGRFVADNYRDLKEQRLFSCAVPRALGGGGIGHRELCHVLRELARSCASTALALSMHSHLVATAVWRHRHGLPGEALLRKVAQAELVLVSTGAGDWVDSVGHAERVSGGYRVSGVKRFCSGSPLGDLLITSAPVEQGEGGPEVIHFPVPLRSEGVELKQDWDTLGMRGTGSHSIELNQVFVADDAIVLRRPRGQWHGSWNVIVTIAAPIYMAPYIGIAERAAVMARAAAARRKVDESTLLLLGELDNSLTLAQLAWRDMLEIANDYDVEPTLDHANRTLIRKTLAANAARETVAKAVEVTGGAAFYCSLGLERLWRDVQGAAFHPLPEKKQLAFSGRVTLGMSPVG